MSDINSRIQRVIAESGLTKTAFAAKLNVSQQHVSRLSSYGAPSERTIVDICDKFGVNETWLRTGEGPKVRVHDGEDGEGVLVAAAHLLLGFLVGHHGPGIQLRPGAGGGGNGHNGQGLVLHLFAAAGAAVHVVPVIALIGGHHGNGLGRVNAAAAAQAQDKVTAVGPGAGRAVHHIVQDGVGQNLVKHGVGHPGLGQLVLHNVQVAVGPGGFAAGNDDQGMLARQTLLVQLLDRALAKDQVGGNVERKAHG